MITTEHVRRVAAAARFAVHRPVTACGGAPQAPTPAAASDTPEQGKTSCWNPNDLAKFGKDITVQ